MPTAVEEPDGRISSKPREERNVDVEAVARISDRTPRLVARLDPLVSQPLGVDWTCVGATN